MVAIISVSVGRRINFGPFAANYKRNQQDKEVKSMTRIDIISGFLGAGKTTLIKKLLGDALKGQQVVLIENEFGEIGIDGGFLKDAGIEIREMNSGCICCSLVGDFGAALKDVITKYHPDRIIIEPSGVGKLSDVIKAVDGVEKEAGVALNSATTVVDVMKCKMYLRNFGEFFENQVKSAGTIILSRTDKADTAKVEAAVKMLRELNPEAHIITTPVEVLGGKKVLDTMEGAIINLEQVEEEEHHHHHQDHGALRRGGRGGGGDRIFAVWSGHIVTAYKRGRISEGMSAPVLCGFLTRLGAGFLVYCHQFIKKEGITLIWILTAVTIRVTI